jgi:hypothetical protein
MPITDSDAIVVRVSTQAALERGEHAERQREHDRDHHAGDRELDGVREHLEDLRGDRGLALRIGALHAERAVDDVAEEAPELHVGGLVEPHAVLHLLALVGGRLAAEQHVDRIARHEMEEREHQDRHAHDRERP